MITEITIRDDVAPSKILCVNAIAQSKPRRVQGNSTVRVPGGVDSSVRPIPPQRHWQTKLLRLVADQRHALWVAVWNIAS